MSRRGAFTPWVVVFAAALVAGPMAATATADAPPALTSAQAALQVGLRNSDDVGLRVDLRAELLVDGTLVSAGSLASVGTGSSGFNNARRNLFNLDRFAPYPLLGPSVFTLRLLARNACTGSGKNSGSIRLWLNDFSALSAAVIVIGDHGHVAFLAKDGGFLRAANGPRQWIDVAVGAKCGQWRPIGSWSGAL
jgi:hypothetical protein